MPYRSIVLLCVSVLFLLAACAPTSSSSDPEQLGRQLFLQSCGACHATVGDTVIVGPSLAGIASRAGTMVDGLDAGAYIEQSILDPGAYVNPGFANVMPTSFGSFYSDAELEALVEYLLTLE